FKLRSLKTHIATGIANKRSAIKHQFVLPAHLVDVHHRQTSRILTQAVATLLHFILRKGRGIEHQHGLCTGVSSLLRAAAFPEVLANRQAETHTINVKHKGFAARTEIAFFVEHAVIGEFLLAVLAYALAI